jgi:uncharacterized protein
MTKIISNLGLLFLLALLPAVLFAQDSNFTEDMKRLAEQGHADAQYDLGLMYQTGRGVPENYVEAVKWYRLSAEQGFAFAQLNLGLLYTGGDGVPENYLISYVWISVSAAQGNQSAKAVLDELKTILTNEQIAQGQTLAATCFESNYKDCP